MNDKSTGFEATAEQRQSWVSIAMVWAGGMICVPCLMVGGVLSGGGLSLSQIVISILIGYGLICAYMIFIGMQACDTGLPVAVMAEGGLALSNLLGFDESKFKTTTGIAGAVGTLLAAFGLLNAFQGFLSLMSALIPPLAGVVIAGYWIICKGKKESFRQKAGFSLPGVAAFTIGALAACITGGTFASFPGLVAAMPFLNTPFFVGPVNGIVLSLVVYAILKKIIK